MASWEFVKDVIKTAAWMFEFDPSSEFFALCKEAYEAADKESQDSIISAIEPIFAAYKGPFKNGRTELNVCPKRRVPIGFVA